MPAIATRKIFRGRGGSMTNSVPFYQLQKTVAESLVQPDFPAPTLRELVGVLGARILAGAGGLMGTVPPKYSDRWRKMWGESFLRGFFGAGDRHRSTANYFAPLRYAYRLGAEQRAELERIGRELAQEAL